jgi:hypothetical protein
LTAEQTDEELIECIDSVFDLFGQNVKLMIYCTWLKADVSSKGILGDPEAFASHLREMFGIAGETIEILFVREIRKRFSDKPGTALPSGLTTFPALVRGIKLSGKTQEETESR